MKYLGIIVAGVVLLGMNAYGIAIEDPLCTGLGGPTAEISGVVSEDVEKIEEPISPAQDENLRKVDEVPPQLAVGIMIEQLEKMELLTEDDAVALRRHLKLTDYMGVRVDVNDFLGTASLTVKLLGKEPVLDSKLSFMDGVRLTVDIKNLSPEALKVLKGLQREKFDPQLSGEEILKAFEAIMSAGVDNVKVERLVLPTIEN